MKNPDEIKRAGIIKRPFFFCAVIMSLVILAFDYFAKDAAFKPGHISNFALSKGRYTALKGRIINDPFYGYSYFKKRQYFTLQPELIRIERAWRPVYGGIKVISYSDKELKYGDEILFEAKLKEPASRTGGTFDYKRYLARQGIYAVATIAEKDPVVIVGNKGSSIKKIVYSLKTLLIEKLEVLFRAPERYFLIAILLGERQDIPDEWNDIFIKTQTMHLIAISGLHIVLIVFIIIFFLGIFPMPRNFKYVIAILFLLFYAVMVGCSPSVVRATVMGVVVLGSYVLKRDADIYNSLGLAAVLMLLYNTEQLFDTGFILSFMSVLSVVYLTPKINEAIGVDKIKRDGIWGGIFYYTANLFTAAFAVWLGLMPVNANFFNMISPVSLLANLLAIPLFFVIITFSFCALFFYQALPFLGKVFSSATEFFTAFEMLSLRFFSNLPFAYFYVKPARDPLIFLYYSALIIIFEKKRLRKFRREFLRKSEKNGEI